MKLPINYEEADWQTRKKARELYIKEQKGRCQHCKKPLEDEPADYIQEKTINYRLFPSSFFKYPVHLHHCHKTGMTIGAVHNTCNAVLWQYHGE